MPIVANLAVFGISCGSETEYVADFSHIHVYSASSHYPMSIVAIDPVCSQAILPMRVTLFPSVTLCVTNIPSISYRNTLPSPVHADFHNADVQGGGVDATPLRVLKLVELSGKTGGLLSTSTRDWWCVFQS